MESLTKNLVSFDTIKALVARAYGQELAPTSEDAIKELGHGWFNVAYRVTLANGDRKVLKVAPSPDVEVLTHEIGAMRTELAAIDLIKANTTVPVAHVDFSDFSCELVNAPYFFMDYIDGQDPGDYGNEFPPGALSNIMEHIGKLNYELNQMVGPGFGPLLDPKYPDWPTAYAAMFEQTLQDGERRNVELGWPYQTFRDIFEQEKRYLADVTVPNYVELDMWDKALILKDGQPAAHIDHERAFYGDPMIEAGFTALDFPNFGDIDAFMRGYGKTEVTDSERARRKLYTLQLALVMVIECTYRGYDDPAHVDPVQRNLVDMMSRYGYTK